MISLCIGFGFKAQLKTTRTDHYARNYARVGSLRLYNSRDIYLFSRTNRVRIDSDGPSCGGGSSSHRSLSGRSHGGSSGRF